MRDFDVGHFTGHGDQIVGEAAGQEMTVLVIAQFFVQRGADTLDDATAYLLLDQQRVQNAAAIMHHHMAQGRDQAAVHINLDNGGLQAVAGQKHAAPAGITFGHGQVGADAVWNAVGLKVTDPGDFRNSHMCRTRGAIDDHALVYVQVTGVFLQLGGGDVENVLF